MLEFKNYRQWVYHLLVYCQWFLFWERVAEIDVQRHVTLQIFEINHNISVDFNVFLICSQL